MQIANSVQLISTRFNYALALVSTNPLTKSLPLVALFWGFWFARGDSGYPYRATVLAGAIVSIAAIVLGRLLALTLPVRLRPMHDPDVLRRFSDKASAVMTVSAGAPFRRPMADSSHVTATAPGGAAVSAAK